MRKIKLTEEQFTALRKIVIASKCEWFVIDRYKNYDRFCDCERQLNLSPFDAIFNLITHAKQLSLFDIDLSVIEFNALCDLFDRVGISTNYLLTQGNQSCSI